MQVMNSKEFEQTSVLLGNNEKSVGFGVSDDPMLMSMLSTGLYQNPLRTMIQEIMFNAWDAHRMGNCQDKPIDIYLNDTTGLMIRDYGPGIHPEDIHPIYCIYGNSTKRNDKGQTGGFGLGSKSPFAYTDSFNVTSMHEGERWMYLINRATEENNGGPGLTTLIKGIPTEESGLLVSVPMKNDHDLKRAYNYIKDVLYLSGIIANIHYMDGEAELIVSKKMEPGAYINNDDQNGIWAVYGGVRYRITEDDGFSSEYQFVQTISRMLGGFFIGFAPDTLTPLPNREGLNMSEKSVESIKSALETIQDTFMIVCKPAMRAAMEWAMGQLKSSGIQPQFIAHRWYDLGDTDLVRMVEGPNSGEHLKKIFEGTCPPGVSENVWFSMLRLAVHKTTSMKQLMKNKEFRTMRAVVFGKAFPEYAHLTRYLIDREHDVVPRRQGYSHPRAYDVGINDIEFPNYVYNLNNVLDSIREQVDSKVDLRMTENRDAGWFSVSGLRGGGKLPKYITNRQQEKMKKQIAEKRHKTPSVYDSNRLWNHKTGNQVDGLMMEKTIVIAKTVSALNDTNVNLSKIFAPNIANVGDSWSHDPFYHENFYRRYDWVSPIPGIIVHQKKGSYVKAIKILRDLGWNVIEGAEPEVKTKRSLDDIDADYKSARRGPATYPLLDTSMDAWASETEIEKPKGYLYQTAYSIREGYYWSRPDVGILREMTNRYKDIVIIHSANRVTQMTKKGIPEISVLVEKEIERLMQDEDRLLKMYIHSELIENCELPVQLLKIQEVQKTLGVPYIRSNQRAAFDRDWHFLKLVIGSRDDPIVPEEAKKKLKEKIAEYQSLPSLSSVHKVCQKTSVFDKRELQNRVSRMKPGEVKMLSQKVIRFLRTV